MSRRAELAQIHIAKKDLALTDETYRRLLQRVTGQDSAANLDVGQRGQVIQEFKRLGWKPRGRKRQLEGQAAKIRALWWVLYRAKAVRDKSERAMNAWIYKQTRVNNVRWLNVLQARTVIEQLKKWCDRLGVGYE